METIMGDKDARIRDLEAEVDRLKASIMGLTAHIRDAKARRMCTAPGCTHAYYARGMCDMHYRRWERAGKREAGWVDSRRKFSDEAISDMRADYARGVTQAQIMRKYNAARSYVSNVVRGHTRKSAKAIAEYPKK